MPKVSCGDVGADTCKAHFEADTRDELVRKVHKHLQEVHNVPKPTQTLMTLFVKHSR